MVQKLFGESNKAQHTYEAIFMEGIKLLELWFLNDGRDNDHWLGIMVDNIEGTKECEYYPQWFFALLDEEKNVSSKLSLIKRKINLSPTKIIDRVMKRLLKEKAGGQLKYEAVLREQFKDKDPEDYIQFFKFLAMYLTGQIKTYPFQDNETTQLLLNGKVNYNKEIRGRIWLTVRRAFEIWHGLI